ncbi:farnesyltransferas-like protein [Cucurbitaria berberidis CBS 394.84]|uniref:Protein farnesyltransferase/geranylgeranyltransferase type-1 subunit alpha n=1 Tax=Cucurbitaria berberidis CBS 394.84 TaxID=1168544 RepID=A0A9P4L8Z4_9PLEO|nr:farnesyltransferas-like protein [Cucurbitaria berberidis CBS 394.84]KAF1845689.1 farnesyltransferas-like protein [Cucurbitaria berberidis CBS 394.84]
MALNFICGWLSAIFCSPIRLLHALLPRLFAGAPSTSFVEASPNSKETRMPKFYHDDEAWADIEPLAQDDGGMHPLAAIAYTEEYSEAMGYLRAVMAQSEFSERVLELTEHIISMNPAHYTVWLYRAKVTSEIGRSLQDEIAWLNPTALKHLKNYQIWHHRQTIINALGSPEGEPEFISTMLEQDSKNYHVWSYRQWLVKRFDLFDKPEELTWTDNMIQDDVRNNSAWNHRYYLVAGRGGKLRAEIADREIEYTKAAIRKAPQNQSPWNYISGIVRVAQLPKSTLKDFALEFADVQTPEEVYSSHALDILADIYSEEENSKESAEKALDLLATKYDPIRANYWNFRKGLLEQPTA